jgi:hypothetical protein
MEEDESDQAAAEEADGMDASGQATSHAGVPSPAIRNWIP